LEDEQIRLLQSLTGWTWAVHEARWEATYDVLKEYIRQGSRMPPPKQTRFMGVDLYSWIKTQQKKWLNHQLTQSQIEQLEQLRGWRWESQDSKSKTTSLNTPEGLTKPVPKEFKKT
jgi:hypothetical protein